MSDRVLDAVGKSIPRRDAVAKAVAQVKYLDDLKLPGMLWGKILRSDYPHARILRLDTSRAEQLEGVKAIVTPADFPVWRGGRQIKDRTIIARDKVRYTGDVIAAVAAVDLETAERALGLIEVEYEELPVVTDPEEAMKPDAPLIHEEIDKYVNYKPGEAIAGFSKNVASYTLIERGDVDKGFAGADLVVEETYRTQRQCNSPLETHGAIATADPFSGKITIWTTTASPRRVRAGVSEFAGIPASKINVITSCVGGSFGSKLEADPDPFCALLAKKSGKPVKMVFMRSEELRSITSRHPAVVRIKTGVTSDGRLVARDVKAIYNAGARANVSALVTAVACALASGPYKVPNVRITGYSVYTNSIPGGAFRGFGDPQVCFAYESHMDVIAEKLGIDPLELRLRNLVEEGEVMPHGHVMRSVTIRECIDKAVERSNYREKKANKTPGRGVGLACADELYGGFPSGAVVRLNEDGTVTVIVGATEIGQGSDTILGQIAADAVGVNYEDVSVVPLDTDGSPFDMGSFASRVTYHLGNAVRMASAEVKRQIFEVAADVLEASTDDLEARGGKVFVKGFPDKSLPVAQIARVAYFIRERSIVGTGTHGGEEYAIKWNALGTTYDGPMATNAFGAQVAEVEVDEETGEFKVLKITAALDCGRAINPRIVEGQIEGGVGIGVGLAMFEDLQTVDGRIVNGEFKDYLIPTALDVPDIEGAIVELEQHDGPFGAKGVGDGPPVAVAPAIANAIYDAVGVRIRELPITPEKVLKALEEKKGG